MSVKKIVSFVISSAIVLFGLFCVVEGISSGNMPSSLLDIPNWSSSIVQSKFSKSKELTQIAPTILLAFGPKEQDGIFITED